MIQTVSSNKQNLTEFVRDIHRDVTQFESIWAGTHTANQQRGFLKWWEDFKLYVEEKDAFTESPCD